MEFDLQPSLENDLIKIQPLMPEDFDLLFEVASDPHVWEQHPNKDRYKREVFQNFFKGAIESKGAFLVFDNKSDKPIGSSRYYGFDSEKKTVSIGYTFLAKEHWGTTYNRALKTLMLDHAFRFVNEVTFHIGAVNIRSQKAIEKLGARKTGEADIEYYGEGKNKNFIYMMDKETWTSMNNEQ